MAVGAGDRLVRLVSALKRQKAINAHAQLNFFFFIQSGTPAHGTVLPRVNLTNSINLI